MDSPSREQMVCGDELIHMHIWRMVFLKKRKSYKRDGSVLRVVFMEFCCITLFLFCSSSFQKLFKQGVLENYQCTYCKTIIGGSFQKRIS